jgi:hypothetical protein
VREEVAQGKRIEGTLSSHNLHLGSWWFYLDQSPQQMWPSAAHHEFRAKTFLLDLIPYHSLWRNLLCGRPVGQRTVGFPEPS